MTQPPSLPSFREAFAFWLKLGFISFGGPAGQISIMHDYLVDKKKWISDSRFMHALNYCMLLPGPEAQQLATYCGWLLHGVRGGLVAGLLFILPSAVMLWILSLVYVTYGDLPLITAMFSYLKLAVVAIILAALLKIGKKSLSSPIHYFIAVLAFALIYFFNIPFPIIILAAMLTGLLLSRMLQKNNHQPTASEEDLVLNETGYVVNQNSIAPGKTFRWRLLMLNMVIFSLLWVSPLLILYASGHEAYSFWEKLSVFFTKAAFVTFGGAYAVLPYVAQVSVETFGWLTQYEMIDGLALGETTPGPLIMVLAFVGFMAGYNMSGESLFMATLGLTLTTYYTFLPSFLFIFSGAPFIERTQTNVYFKSVLGYISAAVTGVILNLGLSFGLAVVMPLPPQVLWIPCTWMVISFIALHFLNVNMIGWIGISLAFGIITFILHGT